MICLVGLCIVNEAVDGAILVSDELPDSALVLDLNYFPLKVQLEDVKSARRLIIFVKDMRVDTKTIILGPIARRFIGRLPHKFKLFVGFSESSLLCTNAREEEGFEAYALEELWGGRGVTEGVNRPGMPRYIAEG